MAPQINTSRRYHFFPTSKIYLHPELACDDYPRVPPHWPEVDLPASCMHWIGIWFANRGVVHVSLYACNSEHLLLFGEFGVGIFGNVMAIK